MKSKITYSQLADAKAFLCWDRFPGLSIQMVETSTALSYFLPPHEMSTIILFYEKKCTDFSHPLFLLFHEAGHYQQYMDYDREGDLSFTEMINEPTGIDRMAFEEEAWDNGAELFEEFIEQHNMALSLNSDFNKIAHQNIRSYA